MINTFPRCLVHITKNLSRGKYSDAHVQNVAQSLGPKCLQTENSSRDIICVCIEVWICGEKQRPRADSECAQQPSLGKEASGFILYNNIKIHLSLMPLLLLLACEKDQ